MVEEVESNVRKLMKEMVDLCVLLFVVMAKDMDVWVSFSHHPPLLYCHVSFARQSEPIFYEDSGMKISL